MSFLPPPRRALRVPLALATALAAACGGGTSDAPAPSSPSAPPGVVGHLGAPPAERGAMARRARVSEATSPAGAAGGDAVEALTAVAAMDSAAAPPAPVTAAAAGAPTAGAPASAAARQPADASAAAPMLIRTGTASVEVDSLDAAVARVQALAARLGGYVGNTTLAGGREQVRTATLELKLPAARFGEALAGLRPLGRVDSVATEAQDVGEEFVDVTARAANARRLEARLVALLAGRTARLADVLAVERELARVREEIERYEGRLRYLRARSAFSTLSVTVHERGPLVGTSPAGSPVADAFRDAWRNFVAVTAGAIAASGLLVPLGAAAYAAWRLAEWLRRRAAVRAAARAA